jgi:peptidoglycan/xylan/chitin deacetylase (PgdA/CDA1 family)
MNNQPRSPTGIALIILTLITGLALGWLLRDTLGGPAAQGIAPTPQPTTDDRRPTTIASIVTPIPSLAPVPQPTTDDRRPTTIDSIATPPSSLSPAPAFPTPSAQPPTPNPQAPSPEIAGYIGHVVAAGETLATIAKQAGSTPDLIARYNLLAGEPGPGRALIVPRLAGRAATLASEPLLVTRGRADKPWVALTLDAGASAAPTPRMLTALRERQIRITFFLTGQWIKENPDLARQIAADGHEIANHTFTHRDLTRFGDAALRKELADTEALLKETAGVSSRPLFRPPYGAYDEQVLRAVVGQGYLPIYWTLDSLDSVGEPKTPEFLLERITRKLTPEQLRGAIILAHCGSDATADALPKILDRFAEMGFEVKKVSEVLGA